MPEKKTNINLKDIFWEYEFTQEDIVDILEGQDFQKKKFLFEKILLNSKNMFLELSEFSIHDLKTLLESYQPGNFNREFVTRRKAMAETFFFEKPINLPEFQWKA
jgi:hypothetical protein